MKKLLRINHLFNNNLEISLLDLCDCKTPNGNKGGVCAKCKKAIPSILELIKYT